jgi:hypothetical protein
LVTKAFCWKQDLCDKSFLLTTRSLWPKLSVDKISVTKASCWQQGLCGKSFLLTVNRIFVTKAFCWQQDLRDKSFLLTTRFMWEKLFVGNKIFVTKVCWQQNQWDKNFCWQQGLRDKAFCWQQDLHNKVFCWQQGLHDKVFYWQQSLCDKSFLMTTRSPWQSFLLTTRSPWQSFLLTTKSLWQKFSVDNKVSMTKFSIDNKVDVTKFSVDNKVSVTGFCWQQGLFDKSFLLTFRQDLKCNKSFLLTTKSMNWFPFYYVLVQGYQCFSKHILFSSPELEAQVSFFWCVRLTFSTSPEPLGQFQPKLAQIIFRQRDSEL